VPNVRVVVPGPLGGERVDRVVSFLTGMPRSEAALVIGAGSVVLGGRPVTSRSQRVSEGEVLEVVVPDRPGPPSADVGVHLTVIHADDSVVVIDKPAGLVVHPGAGNPSGTLVQGMLARFPDIAGRDWPDGSRPGIVHRLDKGTSGLLMVARTPEALISLASQLEHRTVERRYLALVWGSVEPATGTVDAPLGRSVSEPTKMAVRADGRRAVTHYEVVRTWAAPQPATLLRCTLETGRTHQVRVHLAAIAHPVVGDDRYRRRGAAVAPGVGPGRPFLHAAALGFDHPATGRRMRFSSALPQELEAVLAGLA